MAQLSSLAPTYIENNKAYLLKKYYAKHADGAVILLFNRDGSLHQDYFMTKSEIQSSSTLPSNAYSEAQDFWINNPRQLTFMSWFYPITPGTSFNVYCLGTVIKTVNLNHSMPEKLEIVASVTKRGVVNVDTDQDAIGFIVDRYLERGYGIYWGRGPYESELQNSSYVVVDINQYEKNLKVVTYPDGSRNVWDGRREYITINYKRIAKQVFFVQSPHVITGPEVFVELVDDISPLAKIPFTLISTIKEYMDKKGISDYLEKTQIVDKLLSYFLAGWFGFLIIGTVGSLAFIFIGALFEKIFG